MKSISLYVDKDTYLTRMHPFTKLCYILTAVAASLITGKLWAFAIFIGISLVMLISGKIMKKVFPLIAFSFAGRGGRWGRGGAACEKQADVRHSGLSGIDPGIGNNQQESDV